MGVADNFIGIPIYDSKGNLVDYIDIDKLLNRIPRVSIYKTTEWRNSYKQSVIKEIKALPTKYNKSSKVNNIAILTITLPTNSTTNAYLSIRQPAIKLTPFIMLDDTSDKWESNSLGTNFLNNCWLSRPKSINIVCSVDEDPSMAVFNGSYWHYPELKFKFSGTATESVYVYVKRHITETSLNYMNETTEIFDMGLWYIRTSDDFDDVFYDASFYIRDYTRYSVYYEFRASYVELDSAMLSEAQFNELIFIASYDKEFITPIDETTQVEFLNDFTGLFNISTYMQSIGNTNWTGITQYYL